jgi:small conductance mechanosensitive channel
MILSQLPLTILTTLFASQDTPQTTGQAGGPSGGQSSPPSSPPPATSGATQPPPPKPDVIADESLADTAVSMFKSTTLPKNAAEWEAFLITVGVKIGIPALLVLAAFIAAIFFSKTIQRASEKALVRAKVEITLAKFLGKFAGWIFLGLVLLTILSSVGVNVTSLAALIGATGLAIGLALQGALTNLSAGIMLLVFRPYRLGDVVRLDGDLGTVADMELFTTKIDTFDNRRIILPNSRIYGNKIENLTRNQRRRVEVPVGVAYGADIDQTRGVLERAITGLPGVLVDPPPVVIMTGFGNSSVDWEIRVWCAPAEIVAVRSVVIRAIKYALDEAEISIPFPQRDLHIDGVVQVAMQKDA